MNSSQNSIDDKSWERLIEVLEAFSAAWEAAPPEPNLEEFASHFPESDNAQFHIIALAELVKLDMDFRARSQLKFQGVSDYAIRWPGLKQNGRILPDLVYEEARIRKSEIETTDLGLESSQSSNIGKIANLIDPDITVTTSILSKLKTPKFEPGMTIDDFDLLSELGRGSFAAVFLARQNSMQRLVALKISADQGVEGQTLAQLDHPHIVRVYDQRVFGEPPVRLMYMQYIAGCSLKEVIDGVDWPKDEQFQNGEPFIRALDRELDGRGEPIPVQSDNRNWIAGSQWHQVVSRLGSQLAGALAYSHSQGVLHRDIKPANVLVDLHGYPKLVDFNVSFSSEVPGTTAAAYFGGSLAYMSPEQLEACGHEFDRTPDTLNETADIYSLGVLLYELLTGDRPFSNDDIKEELSFMKRQVEVRRHGMDGSKSRVQECENELLVEAIGRCLAPDPVDRFQKAGSLRQQLFWASEDSTANYLNQSNQGWRKVVGAWPFLSVILSGLAISMFATWFVISFNAEEAIAEKDLDLFHWLRTMVNRIVYPIVMVVSYFLVRPVSRALKDEYSSTASSSSTMLSEQELKSAIDANLNLGSYLALAFAIAWSVSGISYPLFLTVFGASVNWSTWTDFTLSHVLAGLMTAAYFFCATTVFSLGVWHPRLIRISTQREIEIEVASQASVIQTRNRFFQVLAIATPLAAMAVLVNLRTGMNTFAVGVLSTASFFGLGVLSWTARQIESSIKTLRQM